MSDKKNTKHAKLLFQSEFFWDKANINEQKKAMDFGEKYKDFLNKAKTERQTVVECIHLAKKAGYNEIDFESELNPKRNKLIFNNRNKNLILVELGKDGFTNGVKMLLAHVDSPRLDLKVRPLYEDSELAYFKSYYYGGIKKYQWPTIPLSMFGNVVLKNGEEIEINIGEKKNDPIFLITDLLPHLDRERMEKKTMDKAIEAEEMNILVGSIPIKDKKEKDRVKLAVLTWLNKEYKITEKDLFTADIRFVPSWPVRDVGFDRSMLAGYGHDDRVCVYTTMEAFLEADSNETKILFLVDKEEIASVGTTSANSLYLEGVISWLLRQIDSPLNIYDVFRRSSAISGDVSSAYDPDYKQVYDATNSVYLGKGVVIEKHVGRGGKYHTVDAEPGFLRTLVDLFDKKNIVWQTGHLGKVDNGGGGTISAYLAKRNVEVVDMGPAIFNMHAPYELVSKGDVYSTYKGYKVFLES